MSGISKRWGNSRFGISRRTFVKMSGLALTAFAASRLIRRPAIGADVTTLELPQGEGVITEELIPTSCLNCGTRCATRVRVVNGRAVKVTGNPLSMISEGENCARAHVGLQVLYDPERITTPLKRTNPAKGSCIDPGWTSISWDEALGEIGNKLKGLRDSGEAHRLLVFGGLNTTSDEDIIERFAASYGTPNLYFEDSLEDAAIKTGSWMADGHYSRIAYDLERTNYILAFGADILESEKPVARNLRFWGKIRRERPNRAKIVAIDPRYSVTAAKADRWVPINPGTEGALAMAIAGVLISDGLYDPSFLGGYAAGIDQFAELATSRYSPETVAGITGIPAADIREIAREFGMSRPAIAWPGRGATAYPNGAYNAYAIHCLNALIGSINTPGGVLYQQDPGYRPLPDIEEDDAARTGKTQPRLDLAGTERFPAAVEAINQVAGSILSDTPYAAGMAIGFNSNLNMTAPCGEIWGQALEKVPYYVHVAPFVSEMAAYADIVLPACTYMETYAYDHSPPGSGFAELKIKQPVVAPLGESRMVADVVFAMAGAVGGSVARSFSGIGDNTEGFVKYRTGSIAAWEVLLRDGVSVGAPYQLYNYEGLFKTPSGKFEFRSGNLEARLKEAGQGVEDLTCLPHYEEISFLGDEADYPLSLETYHPLLNVDNGSQNYPWAQEIFLVMHGRGWGNFAEINAHTAHELGIKDGDSVWVESHQGRINLKARVIEGIHPEVVAIAAGQGHTAAGEWAQDIGANPNSIIVIDYDRISGQAAFLNTRVKVYRA